MFHVESPLKTSQHTKSYKANNDTTGIPPPAQPRNAHPDDHFRLETLNSLFYTDTITVKVAVAEDGGGGGGGWGVRSKSSERT